jgi:hypothetical protein
MSKLYEATGAGRAMNETSILWLTLLANAHRSGHSIGGTLQRAI